MKTKVFSLILLLSIFFMACETQKPMEEYLNLIQQNKDAGNTEEMIKNYKLLLKYYPDAEKADAYKSNYLQTLFIAIEETENVEYLNEIKAISDSLDNDTTQVWIKYKLFDYLNEKGKQAEADKIIENLDQSGYMIVAQKLLANQKAAKSIEVYKKIIEKFPEGEGLDKVHFLIAFTYSENLKDFENAKTYFGNVVEKYPESDLADDAQWMMENMEKSPEEISFISEGEAESKQ